MDREAFDSLVGLFQTLPTAALRSVASMLYNEKKTRAKGFYFGQKVYVRYRGAANANYLSNFMIARIMSANSEFIRLTSKNGKCNLTFTKTAGDDIIFDVEEFDVLRKKMVAKGKLVDPDAQRLITKKYRAEEEHELNMTSESAGGQVTTIDTVFKDNGVPRRKGKNTVDLIQLVDALQAGHTDVDRTSRVYKRNAETSRRGGTTIIDVSGD